MLLQDRICFPTDGPSGTLKTVTDRPPRQTALLVVGSVLALLVLRLVELRTLAHLLYAQELMGLGSLAWDLDHGGLTHDGTLAGFIATYQYNHFDQGTLVVQALFLGLSRLFGTTGFVFHCVGIGLEAVTVGCVAWLGSRLAGPRSLWAMGALLFPPAFVVAWQLLPYGNHTDFLFIPALLGVLWLRAGQSGAVRLPVLFVLLVVGVVLYRMNAAAGVASVVAALALGGGARLRSGATVVAAGLVALACVFALHAVWPEGQGDGGLLPSVGFGRRGSVQWAFFGAPRNLWGGWPWRLALAVWAAGGLWVGARDPSLRPLVTYLATLAAGALAAPLLLAPPHPEYLLTGLYALLLLGMVGLATSEEAVGGFGRRVAIASAAVMLLAGLADARWLADATTWETTRGFDGIAAHFELGIEDPDADEISSWAAMLASGRGSQATGVATSTHIEAACPLQPGRLDPGPLRAADEDRCPGWSEGALGRRWMDLRAQGWTPTAQQARDFGAGAWVVCGRSLECVEKAMGGVDRSAVLRGAAGEARRAE